MAKKVLGRGLGAYFPDLEKKSQAGKESNALPPPQKRVNTTIQVKISAVELNPHQPRMDFDDAKLQELAASIRQHGLIQPITVRYVPASKATETDRVELISGERRLRAARIAGIDSLPAFVREADDEKMLMFGIIENIQREQLKPVEVAFGYQRLMEECGLTQQDVADRVGKNRSTVTNMLRLLHLPPVIQQGLKSGDISAGHARTLLAVEEDGMQEQLYHKTVENRLSVRQLEQLVARIVSGDEQNRRPSRPREMMPDVARDLGERLAAKVRIQQNKKGGEIKISYRSKQELERLLGVFSTVDTRENQ